MTIDWSLVGAPFVAGVLVALTHVALGREVLRRGIIFIDLTIAQIAALGVIAIEVFGSDGFDGAGWPRQVAAGAAALLAAGVLSWTETRFRELQEALIGSLYIVAASAAMLLLANSPHGGEHLAELLAGQILWVTLPQVVPLAVLSALVLALWFGLPRWREASFYLLFALCVTASVQLVGVYLVFATLILPALAVQGMPPGRGLALGYALAVLGYGLGLVASVPTDWPSGPLVVCVLAALALGTGIVRWVLRRR